MERIRSICGCTATGGMVGLKSYDNRRQEKWDVYVRLQQMSIMAGDAA